MGKPEVDLLKRAAKLCTIEIRGCELGNRFWHPVWLSEHVLVAHTRFGDGFFADPYQLDVRTGRITFLPKVGKHIHTLKGSSWRFSSDKEWILYLQGWLHGYSMVAVKRDGRQIQQWKLPGPLEFCTYFWVPGTHQWIELWGGTNSPDRPSFARLYHLSKATSLWERKLSTSNVGDFIGYGLSGEAILVRNDPDAGNIHLTYLPLPNLDRIHQRTISVGKGETKDLQLATDKQRLTFLRQNSLWTVGLDGSGLRSLGSIHEEGTAFSLAGWQPKTEALMFYCQGTIYRLNL